MGQSIVLRRVAQGSELLAACASRDEPGRQQSKADMSSSIKVGRPTTALPTSVYIWFQAVMVCFCQYMFTSHTNHPFFILCLVLNRVTLSGFLFFLFQASAMDASLTLVTDTNFLLQSTPATSTSPCPAWIVQAVQVTCHSGRCN
ncbi:hypothetical protein K504DRAFT_457882 [Pleomassaria siparia CBS 279.74]|uniref:Uncharacterized protein n=1 Tax=Pleomassaria siparia CBS 279.74 TaxID=1314801 RepID=A0A6G1KSF3_9PLEO|nr:hypothetical protein K504DRAFT_457882 [Pleomassaria siparia CBS 279.74]